MIKHLITLMWSKRRANSMIFLEVLLAFIVLFGVYAFAYYNLERYSSPLGFSYKNSLQVNMDIDDDLDSAGVYELHDRVHREVLELPGVAAASWIGPVFPFGGSNWGVGSDDKGFEINSALMFADQHFAEAAEVTMREGRWYTKADINNKYPPLILNGAFVDKYYPNATTMIDSVFDLFGGERQVVGVVDEFKYQSNFQERYPLIFFGQDGFGSPTESPFERMIVRAEPGQLAAIEEPLYNLLVDLTKQTDVNITNMARDRSRANRPTIIPLVILSLISAFLLINIALGLFGVLFTQIGHRRAEIGLRKAMGATPGEITAQFVGEVILVTLAGLLVGIFFAVQVPLLELLPIEGKYFYYGIIAAILTILLIVGLCAFLPSRQAAGLHPADVLHEE